VPVVPAPGLNLIELRDGNKSDRVSFYSGAPSRDIKIILTWDYARYIDLWVTDPDGEKCYWANPRTKNGGNITANDETGFGPQIFTMQKAKSGTYSIQAQNYDSGGHPVTRVKIYMILFEGTEKESREVWEFVMGTPHTVYHISDFVIPDE